MEVPFEYAFADSRGNEWTQSWSGSQVTKKPAATRTGSSGAKRGESQRKSAPSTIAASTGSRLAFGGLTHRSARYHQGWRKSVSDSALMFMSDANGRTPGSAAATSAAATTARDGRG